MAEWLILGIDMLCASVSVGIDRLWVSILVQKAAFVLLSIKEIDWLIGFACLITGQEIPPGKSGTAMAESRLSDWLHTFYDQPRNHPNVEWKWQDYYQKTT